MQKGNSKGGDNVRRSERIRFTRAIYSLTQQEVADALGKGVSRNYISQIENEKLQFSEDRYKEIMNAIYKVGEQKRRDLESKLKGK